MHNALNSACEKGGRWQDAFARCVGKMRWQDAHAPLWKAPNALGLGRRRLTRSEHILTMGQSDAGKVEMFSRWTNHMQEM
eukprot:798066-Pyramimonas_sp.AAC.1